MRRIICFLFTLLVLFGCTACASGTETLYAEDITDEFLQTEQKSVWGITLTAKEVKPTGLTIVCTQSGGEPTGELGTGSYYVLHRKAGTEWVPVDFAEGMDPDTVAWTAEGWPIPMNDKVEWEVDWSWLYGELPAGEYRIGKSVMDWRAPGDFDEAELYAEFRVK